MITPLKPETEAAVRARAHEIWEQEGKPEGRQDIHWQRAYEAIVEVELMKPQTSAKPTRVKISSKKK